MAMQRERRPVQEFVKFNSVGAAVLGRIVRQGANDNGRFIILEPAGYRPNAAEKLTRYGSLAVGLATDMERQIMPGETGALVLIVFYGTRDVGRPSPLKLYDVFELTQDEARAIMEGRAKFPEPTRKDEDSGAPGVVQDNLPF